MNDLQEMVAKAIKNRKTHPLHCPCCKKKLWNERLVGSMAACNGDGELLFAFYLVCRECSGAMMSSSEAKQKQMALRCEKRIDADRDKYSFSPDEIIEGAP